MVEQVWLRASRAECIDRLVVATDDERVRDAVVAFGGEAMMTAADHSSGTDRVAEVVRASSEPVDLIVNIQGDEPLLTPGSLDRLIQAFDADPRPQIATLSEPIEEVDDLFDPNVVKVVADDRGRALYFSRSPIPYHRGGGGRLTADFRESLTGRSGGLAGYRRHQGIYAYTRDALLELTELPPSSLEVDEGLEQLRALQGGYAIRVVESDFRSLSVDTPADLERVRQCLMEAG